uniref:NADH-ubiquinone oxidoreductase chain 6 n=1 Tax=Acropyga silvestrii TaxID=602227 RepID=A0A6G5NIU0_9HYME|nr:NADH dehydrogenase subunit 6 [Acropyga silvestrii]
MIKKFLIMNLLLTIILLMILFMITLNLNLNPIMILINLIIYNLVICMKISLWKSNYMYSIILFLVMISGLLIIFLYFSSLISNEQTNFKLNKLLLINMNFNIMFFFILNYYNDNFQQILKKFNFLEINSHMKFNETNYQNMFNLYEYPLNNMTILTMFYLLISLFTIIKICSIKSMTLRKIS